MLQNDFTAIDAQDALSTLIKEQFEIDVDMDSGFVSMRETDTNDDLVMA